MSEQLPAGTCNLLHESDRIGSLRARRCSRHACGLSAFPALADSTCCACHCCTTAPLVCRAAFPNANCM